MSSMAAGAGHKVKPSLMPYSVNVSFWSDGAHKDRFVAVPANEGITFNRGVWGFPDKTVLVKSFALEMEEGEAEEHLEELIKEAHAERTAGATA